MVIDSELIKKRELERLRQEIEAKIPDAWLFPTVELVQGFMGTSSVMIVAERPSTGRFAGPADLLLYALLQECGAANGHLTDLIKCRAKVGDPYPDDISVHREIFDRELEILRPRSVIAFGRKVHDLLLFQLAGRGIQIRQVWHYSYARRGQEKKKEFEKRFREAMRF